MEQLQEQRRVPAIYGDFWFNSEPIPLGALGGYIILIDFWDYSCLHCLYTLPYTKEWNRRYNDKGLITIGVHTPQFPFAENPMNVRNAIEKHGIRYPVVTDNNYFIWNSFRSRTWPTKFLVDKHGFIKYVHEGEGSYQNFEHAIQSLLNDSGYHGDFPLVMDPVRDIDRPGAVLYHVTPDIVTGWQRGTIGNVEGFSPESTVHFEDPGVYISGRLYLSGNWLNDRNYLKLNDPEGMGGYLVARYEAKEVNMVIKPEGEEQFQVFVQQDDKYLPRESFGADVAADEEGRTYVIVDRARLFNIVRNKDCGEHILKLSTRSNGFAIYSVSFVSSVIPEMVSNN